MITINSVTKRPILISNQRLLAVLTAWCKCGYIQRMVCVAPQKYLTKSTQFYLIKTLFGAY